jgi:flagellar biosynthetic protein FliO
MAELGQMSAVAGVLTLLALTLWFLRKRGLAHGGPLRGKPARRLECLERLPLSPQHTLHLVRMGDTSLLVASSPHGCSLLHSSPTQRASMDAALAKEAAR